MSFLCRRLFVWLWCNPVIQEPAQTENLSRALLNRTVYTRTLWVGDPTARDATQSNTRLLIGGGLPLHNPSRAPPPGTNREISSCTQHSPASSGQSSRLSELSVRLLFGFKIWAWDNGKTSSTEAQEQPDHTVTRNPETTARAMATELRDARIQGNELWLSSTVKCCAKR